MWASKCILQPSQRGVAQLSRHELTVQSLLDFGALIRVRDEQEAVDIANSLAPEHLHLATRNAEKLLTDIHHYGAAFLGSYSPVALGDYFAGPSHVLPTGATARWASGLSANTFLRSSSVIEYSCEALANAAPDVALLADAEQLTAHRASVEIRR